MAIFDKCTLFLTFPIFKNFPASVAFKEKFYHKEISLRQRYFFGKILSDQKTLSDKRLEKMQHKRKSRRGKTKQIRREMKKKEKEEKIK